MKRTLLRLVMSGAEGFSLDLEESAKAANARVFRGDPLILAIAFFLIDEHRNTVLRLFNCSTMSSSNGKKFPNILRF